MTIMKQGSIAQVLAVLVDKTNFASIESAVTSNFTVRLFSIKQGVSTAASTVTISRVPSVVRSGIIRVTIKASELSGIDAGILQIQHASCADQNIPLTFEMQDISDAQSDLRSYLVGMSGMLSDIDSALTSQFIYTSGVISDMHSDLRSQISGITATISASDISNIASHVWSLKYNPYSAVLSSFGSFIIQQTQNTSNLLSNISGLISDVDSQLLLNASMISDIASTLDSDIIIRQSQFSDIMSNIDAVTVSISASDISDIVSAVWSAKYNTYSLLASSFGSFITQYTQSSSNMLSNISAIVSDVYSNVSDFKSDFQSRVPTLVATFSQLSDVRSDIFSYLTGMSGMLSDVYSNLSDFKSDFQSRVPKQVADASNLLIVRSMTSDAHNAALQANSRILLVQSLTSDIDSALTSQYTAGHPLTASDMSDLRSAITGVTATISASDISDIASAVSVKVWSDYESKIGSTVSDFNSALIAGLGGGLTVSNISDIASRVWSEKYNLYSAVNSSFGSFITQQTQGLSDAISNVQSTLDSDIIVRSSQFSDIMSNIDAVNTSISVSDISDIVSAVWSAKYNTYSATSSSFGSFITQQTQGMSNYLSNISGLISNVDSAVSSQYSDVTSKIGNIQTSISASDISGIASKVWSEKYNVYSAIVSSFGSFITQQTQGLSNAVSDMHSDVTSYLIGMSALLSNVESQVDLIPTVNNSAAISNMHSDILSYLTGMSGMLSDVHSTIDDMSNVLSNTHGDLQNLSNIASQILGDTADISNYLSNMSNILSDISSRIPAGFTASAGTIVQGSVNSDITITLSNFATTLTEATNDHYNGRVLIFTTGALKDQATTISDYLGGTSQIYVTPLTEAPVNGDSFVIV